MTQLIRIEAIDPSPDRDAVEETSLITLNTWAASGLMLEVIPATNRDQVAIGLEAGRDAVPMPIVGWLAALTTDTAHQGGRFGSTQADPLVFGVRGLEVPTMISDLASRRFHVLGQVFEGLEAAMQKVAEWRDIQEMGPQAQSRTPVETSEPVNWVIPNHLSDMVVAHVYEDFIDYEPIVGWHIRVREDFIIPVAELKEGEEDTAFSAEVIPVLSNWVAYDAKRSVIFDRKTMLAWRYLDDGEAYPDTLDAIAKAIRES